MDKKMIFVNPNFTEIEVVRNGKSRFYFYSHRIHCILVSAHGLVSCHGHDNYGNPTQNFITVKQYDSHGFAL